MQKIRVYSSGEFLYIDRRFEFDTLRLRFRYHRARGRSPQVLDLERLQDQACKSAIPVEIGNYVYALQSLDSELTRLP